MHGIVQLRSGLSCIMKRFLRGAATYAHYANPGSRNQITLKGADNQSHTGYVQDIRDDAVWVHFSGSRPAEWILKSQLGEKDRQRILDLDKTVHEIKDLEEQKEMEKLTICEMLQAVQREVKCEDEVAFVGISGSTITVLKSRDLPWSSIMHRLQSRYEEKMEDGKEIDRSKACLGDGVNLVLDQKQLDCGYSDSEDFNDRQRYHEHVDQEFLDLVRRSVSESTRILTLRSILSYGFLMKILGELSMMGVDLDTLVLQDSKLILDQYIEITDWPRRRDRTVPAQTQRTRQRRTIACVQPARALVFRNVTLRNVVTGLIHGREGAMFEQWARPGDKSKDVEIVIPNDQIPLKGCGVESQSIIECFERYCPELPPQLEEKTQREWARLSSWKPEPNWHYTGPPTGDIEDLRIMLARFEVGKRHFLPDAHWATVDLQTINTKALRRLTWRAVACVFPEKEPYYVEGYYV